MWSTSRLLRFWISRCLLFMLTLSAVLEGNDRTTVELWGALHQYWAFPMCCSMSFDELDCIQNLAHRQMREWVRSGRWPVDSRCHCLPFPYYSSLNTNCPAILCLSQCLFTVCAHQWVRAKTAWPPLVTQYLCESGQQELSMTLASRHHFNKTVVIASFMWIYSPSIFPQHSSTLTNLNFLRICLFHLLNFWQYTLNILI